MDLSTFQQRFLWEMKEHPNTTAFRLNGEIVTNALFVQRIAPIMNELDTMPEHKIALLIEQDLQVLAAIPAALFSAKQLIPMKMSWTEEQRNLVMETANVNGYLTAQRMQYYFRMTYEDALDRIDNGLYVEPGDMPVATLYDFDAKGKIYARDLFITSLPDHFNLVEKVFDFCLNFK